MALAGSCPYLRQVHDEAVVAGEASGAATNNEPAAWPTQSASLRLKLTAFDLALRAAAVHTPVPIAAKLQAVHLQVSVGLAQLGTGTNRRRLVANYLRRRGAGLFVAERRERSHRQRLRPHHRAKLERLLQRNHAPIARPPSGTGRAPIARSRAGAASARSADLARRVCRGGARSSRVSRSPQRVDELM